MLASSKSPGLALLANHVIEIDQSAFDLHGRLFVTSPSLSNP
jgi:hypothetical protein